MVRENGLADLFCRIEQTNFVITVKHEGYLSLVFRWLGLHLHQNRQPSTHSKGAARSDRNRQSTFWVKNLAAKP